MNVETAGRILAVFETFAEDIGLLFLSGNVMPGACWVIETPGPAPHPVMAESHHASVACPANGIAAWHSALAMAASSCSGVKGLIRKAHAPAATDSAL